MRKTSLTVLFGVVAALVAMMLVASSPADAALPGKVAWLGSPINGYVSSSPSTHHVVYGGQWSVDIRPPNATDSPSVNVYVAVDPQRDPHLSTRILSVGYACGAMYSGESAASRLSRGGKRVTVGVYYDTTRIGTIYYAHVNTSRAIGSYNVAISRWGGSVGILGHYSKVKKPNGTYCWTAPHTHVEAGNASGLSCYWSGLTTVGRAVALHQYLGYVGYNSPTRTCP